MGRLYVVFPFTFVFFFQKLSDIEKLKQLKAAGKALEINQKAKIEGEAALLKELDLLRL